MSDKTQNEINVSAVLDAFVYFDKQKVGFSDWTLGDIVAHMENNPNLADWGYYDTVKQALEQEKKNGSSYLANMVMVSQSAIDSGISGDLLYACTFRSGDDYYVAYRGTGDGKWLDNGEGMYKEETVMQRAAADYFDSVVVDEKLNGSNNIIVTGHSKGGNSAQFVTLAAENRNLIDSCYSFDGQGFSKKAIEKFKSGPGGEAAYQAQLNKMYSINGQNDPVHELGIVVVPSDRTYYVPTCGSNDMGGWHGLQYMITNGEVSIDPKNLVEPGPVAEFAKVLSAEMMQLSEEDLEDCALSIMSFIEAFDGEPHTEGTGDVKFASIEEFCGFISVGIPLILRTAITTEEGQALLGMMAVDAIKGMASSGVSGLMLAGLAAVALTCMPAVVVAVAKGAVTIGVEIWGVATLLDTVLGVFDDKFELSDIVGAAMIGKVIAKAAVFLAGNPQIVIAVLGFIAVVSFISFVIQHWDDISAFAKAAGDFAVAAAVALCAWVENLVEQGTALLISAIGWAVKQYQNAKQAICDFGDMLMAAAAGFFSGIAQAISGAFGGIVSWVKSLFGNGKSALEYGSQIVVTISYIDNLQYRIGVLRSSYLSLSTNIKDSDGVVSRIYVYYTESYVRNCCRNIQTELKNAQKHLSRVEKDLERKRKALSAAVESYRRADQAAANEIRKFSVNCA